MVERERQCALGARRELTYRDNKSLPLVPNLCFPMQMRTSNPYSSSGPKGTVLICQNELISLFSEHASGGEGYSCATLIGQGKPQFCWLKYSS